MEQNTIILKSIVDSIRTLKDKSIKITITTQELSPKNAAELLRLQNQFVSIAINERDITDIEINMLQNSKWDADDMPNVKTHSQRLRAVLYRLWEMNKQGYEDFELYYRFKMENFITHLKNKLD